jgi:hypothetical protein
LFHTNTHTMKIDITPIVEKAGDFDSICLTSRHIEELYVVRTANGAQYSTKFDAKSLGDFQPSKTVSEMLKSWEENIIRRCEEATLALSTGLHPTRTFERDIMVTIEKKYVTYECSTGETEIIRSKIDSYERRHFKHLVKALTHQFGSMEFVKIIN